MKYEALLKKAKKELPEVKVVKERFEIPKVLGHVEGNKTIISNFNQILSVLRRDGSKLIKYLQRALATPATYHSPRLIFGRKLSSSMINEKIKKFAETFVLCKECGRPDTQLVRENDAVVIKCTACGTKRLIRAQI